MNISNELLCLLDSNGRFSSAKIKSCDKKKDDTYQYIINNTLFVDESRTLFDRIKFIINDLTEEQYCKGCGILSKSNRESFNTYCNVKCAKGFIRHKTTQTQETKDKRNNTMVERYGVQYNSQRSDVKQLLGVHFKDPDFIKDNIEKLKKYSGIQYDLLDVDKLKTKLDDGKSIYTLCDDLNCSKIFLQKHLNKNGIYLNDFSCSQPEQIIRNIVAEIGLPVKYNDRHLKKEIDVYLYENNVGIECNGVYWHSLNNSITDKEQVYRHYDKHKLCSDNGIFLLQFWDIEINNRTDIVRSMIRSKLGYSDNRIYARNCDIRDVDNKEANAFVKQNHLSGVSPVASIKKGLYHNDELVMIMTFSIPRFNKNYDLELIRSCTKINHNVIGGFSKLMNCMSGYSVISYADKRYSDGGSYLKNGFVLLKETLPGFKWVTPTSLSNRLKYKNSDGYKKLWDCGHYVFVKEKRIK